MEKKEDALNAITPIIGNRLTAELVIERLLDLGYLQLGYGNGDVDRIVGAFKEIHGTTKVSRTDRYAANRLAKKYGAKSVVEIIRLHHLMSTEKYAPTVASVTQLEDKWVNVLTFLRKRGDQAHVVDA